MSKAALVLRALAVSGCEMETLGGRKSNQRERERHTGEGDTEGSSRVRSEMDIEAVLKERNGPSERDNTLLSEVLKERNNSSDQENQMPAECGPVVVVAKDSYAVLHPGRRMSNYVVGHHRGCQKCSQKTCGYTVDVLDAMETTTVEVPCRVFLVPPQRVEEWLFTAIRGQWQMVAAVKAGRLILVTMNGTDHDNSIAHMTDDAGQLVKQFLPLDCRTNGAIEFVTEENSIKVRTTVALVESVMTGPMLVEDVAVKRSKCKRPGQANLDYYRRLSFRRNPNMIQSEARLVKGASSIKRRGRRDGKNLKDFSKADIFQGLEVDHSVLTNNYHEAIIAAFVLITSNLEMRKAAKEKTRVMILGLGAGSLPMFVHKHLPVTDIEVVELDELVGEIAKRHFGFVEDNKMKLQIGDGVAAVKDLAAAASPWNSHYGACTADSRLHVLIIDIDSKDPSDGMSCPSPECLEDGFLLAGRQALFDDGMLVVNVVASSQKFHLHAKAQLRRVFSEVYEIEVESNVCSVLIGMVQPRCHNDLAGIMLHLPKFRQICQRLPSWGQFSNLQELMKRLTFIEVSGLS